MKRVALWALLSHWRHRPLQFLTLILGISLATALWSGVQAINAEARASYARAASVLEQGDLIQLLPQPGRQITVADYVSLRRAGWVVSPVIEGGYRFGEARIRLIGIDPLSMPREGRAFEISGGNDISSFMGGEGELVVSTATAAKLDGKTDIPLKIATEVPNDAAFTDIAVADRLLQRKGSIDRVVVAPSQQLDVSDLQEAAPWAVLRDPSEKPDVAQLTDSFHLNLTAFGFLAFVVGLFIVYSTIGLSFEQRRSTFRTLRSLGVSLQSLIVLLVLELTVFGLVAGLLGVAIGYLLASALLPGVAATLQGLYGASVSGSLALRPEWWGAGLAMALVGTACASAQNLWQVKQLPILSAAQPQAWAGLSARVLRAQVACGLLLLVLSAVLAFTGTGLVVGFAVLGALLLGAALMIPPLMSGFLKLAESCAGGAVTQWFWADTRVQLPGLSLALMALLLALSANIGVGTMVSSFRLTFIGWLDQRLAAELYVTARDEDEAARLRQWLDGKHVTVLPIWSTEGEVLGRQVEIYGVADDPTYRDHWPLIRGNQDVWDAIASGNSALVNEQLWRQGEVDIGQELQLPGGWKVSVVGVYSDYGNPNGQVIVDVTALAQHYPDIPKLRYGLRVAPAVAADLQRQLMDEFGLPDGNVLDQASVKQRSREVFDQTFTVTGALNVLTLAVAGFAMFASLLTLSSRRLPQLAPVWAMGVRRRNLALLEVVRTLLLWSATFVAAIPLGLVLAWVLLSIINVEAFGWKLPMHVFPMDWLWLGLVALGAALLSVLLPVKRLATVHPADLLRIFANER
jgi:ABC-type antimicrobial peptide transport system, permease component